MTRLRDVVFFFFTKSHLYSCASTGVLHLYLAVINFNFGFFIAVFLSYLPPKVYPMHQQLRCTFIFSGFF